MSVHWQDAGVLLAVGLALTYLVVRSVRLRRKRRPCCECRLLQGVTGCKHNSTRRSSVD